MSEFEARQALQRILDRYQSKLVVRRGLLGNSEGTVMVPNRPGWAYIRYRDDLNQLSIVRYLLQEQLPDDCPVKVGKRYPEDPFEQVLGVDWEMYAWAPTQSTVNYWATQVIGIEDLAPGKVLPTDPLSLLVSVRAFLYANGDTAVEFGGGTLDLSGSVPGVAGHRLTLVYMDLGTDSLAAEDGTIVAAGTDAEAPTLSADGIPLAVVDLANGDASIDGDAIYQYKILYGAIAEVSLSWLADYARGSIIRGGATDWEAYDASTDGAALYGDGTDILSATTPTWKGTHTYTPGDDQGIILTLDAAQSVDIFQVKDSGGNVTSGYDERGIPFADGDTDVTNYFAGADAGDVAASGTSDTMVGYLVGQALTSGSFNTAVGRLALSACQTGTRNSALGANALANATTDDLTAVGAYAMEQTAGGGSNNALGSSALRYNASGTDNIAMGRVAMLGVLASSNTNYCVGIGTAALFAVRTGADANIAIGYHAGLGVTTGAENTLVGDEAGAVLTTQDGNVFLGHEVGKTNLAGADQLAIANSDTTTPLIYGSFATPSVRLGASTTIGWGAAGVDYTLTFDGETNDGVLTWMEDEDYFRFGDTVDMNYQGLQRIYQQTVTVAKAGGDFDVIQDAIDYAVTQVPSATNRFCILIHPGDYAETIVGADYVELMGLAAREAANITGATGPLYTFPDNEGHIFNLKFTLAPTTDAQTIIDSPATVVARQVMSNCLFTVTTASDVATNVFDIKAGEIECINNRVIFTNTNTAGGAVRSQRIWNITGNAIVDLYGNIVDVDIYDVNDRVFIFIDDSLTGGEIHIKENVIRVDSHNAGAYSGAIGFIVYVGATATLHVAHNFVELTSAEAAGTGVGTFARINSAGSGLIRSTANHVVVQGFSANYWASAAAGDTLVSHFDNMVAVDGETGAGTTVYVNSQADGELDVSGDARFGGTVETDAGRIANTTRVTNTYTALVSDDVIFCDTDGSAWTLTLPAGVEGTHYKIVNCGTSGNALTVDPDGAETVWGQATATLNDGDILNLHYNATEGWW